MDRQWHPMLEVELKHRLNLKGTLIIPLPDEEFEDDENGFLSLERYAIVPRELFARLEKEAKPRSETSTITCPNCGHKKVEVMPSDHCIIRYECEGCHRLLDRLPGGCCVFCSFGSVVCPPKANGCCN